MRVFENHLKNVSELASALDAHSTNEGWTQVVLRFGDGAEVELSPDVVELLSAFVDASTEHQRVALVTDDERVSPNDAAALLGVSRPMVMRWIDDGILLSERVGSHHRLAVADVIALQEKRTKAGREAARVVAEEPASRRVRAARTRAQARMAKGKSA
jgi:excisionase family DNA binding protein